MIDRDREYLAHILQYAEVAVRILGPADAVALSASEEKLLAVSRCLQNIGEAATKLSEETRSDLPAVPWRKVIGMRHHLVHAYEDIRREIIVTTIREDLPALISILQHVLGEDGL